MVFLLVVRLIKMPQHELNRLKKVIFEILLIRFLLLCIIRKLIQMPEQNFSP